MQRARRSRSRSHHGIDADRMERQLHEFRERFPMDERAADFLQKSPPEVFSTVIAEFRPRRQGEQDYSALATNFVRQVRDRLERQGRLVPSRTTAGRERREGGSGSPSRRRGGRRRHGGSRRKASRSCSHAGKSGTMGGRRRHGIRARSSSRHVSPSSGSSTGSASGSSSSYGSHSEASDSEDDASSARANAEGSSVSNSDGESESGGQEEAEALRAAQQSLSRVAAEAPEEQIREVQSRESDARRAVEHAVAECERMLRAEMDAKLEEKREAAEAAYRDCIRDAEQETRTICERKISEAEAAVKMAEVAARRAKATREARAATKAKQAKQVKQVKPRKQVKPDKKEEKDRQANKVSGRQRRRSVDNVARTLEKCDAVRSEGAGQRRTKRLHEGHHRRRHRRHDDNRVGQISDVHNNREEPVRGGRRRRRGDQRGAGHSRDGQHKSHIRSASRSIRHQDRPGRSEHAPEGVIEQVPDVGDAPSPSAELESFRERYPMNARAFEYLQAAPLDVQEAVILQFKPRREGEDDYSALVSSFTRSTCLRHEQRRPEGGGGAGGPAHGSHHERQDARVDGEGRGNNGTDGDSLGKAELASLADFRDRYPMDERAFSLLQRATSVIRATVLTNFKPRREGEDDYSALVMSFARSLQTRMPDSVHIRSSQGTFRHRTHGSRSRSRD